MTKVAGYSHHTDHDHIVLTLTGPWTTHTILTVEKKLLTLKSTHGADITLDASALTTVDVTGAWVIKRFINTCKANDTHIHLDHIPPKLQTLLDYFDKKEPIALKGNSQKASFSITQPLEQLGGSLIFFWRSTLHFIEFIGCFLITCGRTLLKPKRLRLTALGSHMYQAGVTALPIIGLISFLIGTVLVYQGASQLKRFGAEIFTVDLLSVSLLREIGILLTAIVVAGRSGSAFTAQIGTMALNQEVDALVVMGLDIHELLVVPRVLSLIICLPLLAFYSDMMGLLGGAVMCHYYIDLGYEQFFHQLNLGLQPWTFWVGIIKAPFFAALIALIGCFEGLEVSGSAASVGIRTTSSVVKSIFIVIIMDAFFSIFFSALV